MSASITLIPLCMLVAIALLSLTWRDGIFTLEQLYNKHLVIAHVVVTSVLFISYYFVIYKVRNTIKNLKLRNSSYLEQLETQKKLLQLETYQHQKANIQLYKLKTQDPLTQLYNQTYFQELLNNEIERSRRYASEFSLLIIELDNFMSINNMYGHEFGDVVIKRFLNL